MASVPPANTQLPLLFSDLTPLSSVEHASWKARASDALPVFARQHAIPLTIDEFAVAQRYYPIIFSAGEKLQRALARLALRHPLMLQRQALCNPLRQRRALDRIYLHRHADSRQRAKPRP